MTKHLNLIFPQWQGGGNDISTYHGAKEIEKFYLRDIPYDTVPVSTETTGATAVNNILWYEDIFKQLSYAFENIENANPSSIFTVGGGCDADIPAIAYLNKKYQGNLGILWFDAHADMNSPKESQSKHFYGMPYRTLLGDGDAKIEELIERKLEANQAMLLGLREMDSSEERYVKDNNISIISVETMEKRPHAVLEEIKEKKFDKIYLHIDLDVLDPLEFPHVPVVSKNGLRVNTFFEILKLLKDTGMIVGIGLYEYMPSGDVNDLLSYILDMGINLNKG